MSQKILIAYATRAGSTGEIAQEIGDALTAKGFAVDVVPVRKVRNLSPYRAVIVGSAVRMGKWQPEAVKFVARFQARLAEVPTAFFTVCLMAKDKTDEACEKVRSFLAPVREMHRPDLEGVFAGRIDMAKLGFIARMMAKATKSPEGDFRDHASIRDWAEEAVTKLKL